jgi:hypothetical protein
MTWIVACFCGQTFTAPLTRCPQCATPLPAVAMRLQPDDRPFNAPINADHQASQR